MNCDASRSSGRLQPVRRAAEVIALHAVTAFLLVATAGPSSIEITNDIEVVVSWRFQNFASRQIAYGDCENL